MKRNSVSPSLCLTLTLAVTVIFVSQGFAFQTNKTSGGLDIKWPTPTASYHINATGGPAGAVTAVLSSMRTWTDVQTSDFTFSHAGGTTKGSESYGKNDGMNIICFGTDLEPDTVAQNAFWYIVATGEITDSDIMFNATLRWSTDGSIDSFDVESVSTHELGHALSLADLYNHTIDGSKSMYAYVSKGETDKRTLDQDDIDGITYLYPGGCNAFMTDDLRISIPLVVSLSEGNQASWMELRYVPDTLDFVVMNSGRLTGSGSISRCLPSLLMQDFMLVVPSIAVGNQEFWAVFEGGSNVYTLKGVGRR